MAKSGRRKRTKSVATKYLHAQLRQTTFQNCYGCRECHRKRKTPDSAPITITIPVTQQMPASTITPYNAIIQL